MEEHSKRIARTAFALALLAGLSACAGAPQLRNVSLQADVSTQISGDEDYSYAGVNYHGAHVGRVALVLDQPISSTLTYRVGAEHMSLLDTDRDRGEERAFAGFTWRPFGGSR